MTETRVKDYIYKTKDGHYYIKFRIGNRTINRTKKLTILELRSLLKYLGYMNMTYFGKNERGCVTKEKKIIIYGYDTRNRRTINTKNKTVRSKS